MKKRVNIDSSLCEEVGPDDGVSPKMRTRSQQTGTYIRKNRQLCKQVSLALTLALQDSSGEPLLSEIMIAGVVPGSNLASLRVLLCPVNRYHPPSEAAVLQALKHQKGALRSFVAAQVNRKKVPDFRFYYLSSPEVCS